MCVCVCMCVLMHLLYVFVCMSVCVCVCGGGVHSKALRQTKLMAGDTRRSAGVRVAVVW